MSRVTLLILLLIGTLSSAQAQIIYLTAYGNITSLGDNPLDSSVQVGTPFTEFLVVDTSTPAGFSTPTISAFYNVGTAYLSFGDYNLTLNISPVMIQSNFGSSSAYGYNLGAYSTSSAITSPYMYLYLFSTTTAIAADSTLHSIAQYPTSDLTTHDVELDNNGSGGGTYFNGTVTSYVVTPIPEPSALELILLGLVAIGITTTCRRFANT